MAAGPPDLVDYAQLAGDAAVLERVYELADLDRLRDVLTETRGLRARQVCVLERGYGQAGCECGGSCASRRCDVSAACRVSP